MNPASRQRLCAILVADVVGFSRLMAEDGPATLAALKRLRQEIFAPAIQRHQGWIVKLMGDGALVILPSAQGAVAAAMEIQGRIAEEPSRPRLRIGINLGDVMEEGQDVYGDSVNLAARLEAMAPPGGLCISALVHACLDPDLGKAFTDAGIHRVKNIQRPIGVFSWPSGAALRPGEAEDMPSRAASVALAPFRDLNEAAASLAIAAGLTEDLVAHLHALDEIDLVQAPAGAQDMTAGQLGRSLGVDWLLRGAVRAIGEHLRVTVELTDCSADRCVWARRFDSPTTADFAFQDSLVEEVATTLQVTVADGEQAMVWRSEAGDPEAYQCFLQARAGYKEYRRAGIERARDLYLKAMRINPRFAAALVGLARTHIEMVAFGWSEDRKASLAEAHRLLEEAFSLVPNHALACSEMAHLLMFEDAFDEGLDWALKATRLAPSFGDAYHVCATLMNCLGRSEDALHYIREAIRRTPTAPDFYLVTLCDAYVGLERWRETATLARRILTRRPDWLMSRAALVIALVGLGQLAEARREAEAIAARSKSFTAARWRRTMFYSERADMPRLEAMLVEAGLAK